MCSAFDAIFQNDFIECDREKIVGNYKLGKILGSGIFSEVRLSSHLLSESKVAIKCIRRLGISKAERQKRVFEAEIKSLSILRHKNIIYLYETMATEKHMYIVLDYIDGKTLSTFIKDRTKLNEDTSRYIIYKIAHGMSYCHDNSIMHRDLKPSNIMVTKDLHIFIIDFGLSCHWSTNVNEHQFCGTPAYTAPEVYCGVTHCCSMDVWSMGVILYEMLTGSLPFYDMNTKHQKHIYGNILKKLKIPENITSECQDLLKLMLTIEHSERISSSNILKHDWLKENCVWILDDVEQTQVELS